MKTFISVFSFFVLVLSSQLLAQQWWNVGSAGFSAGSAGYTSIAIDGSGTPYVGYKDWGNSGKATVMKYNGSSWVNVGSAGFSADRVDYTSIAIAPNGIPVVAYKDEGNSDKATAMQFSLNQSDPLPVELTSFTALVGDENVILNWQTATEVNNYGFSVERSVILSPDLVGTKNLLTQGWQNIGFVEGNGNSNSPKRYSFTDYDYDYEQDYEIQYRLKQIDIDGSFSYSEIVEVASNLQPSTFELFQNYPNPFNPATTIKYTIPADVKAPCVASLRVYDILGNQVATLVNEIKEPGYYEVEFNAAQLTSGVYLYVMRAGDKFHSIKKMLLLK